MATILNPRKVFIPSAGPSDFITESFSIPSGNNEDILNFNDDVVKMIAGWLYITAGSDTQSLSFQLSRTGNTNTGLVVYALYGQDFDIIFTDSINGSNGINLNLANNEADTMVVSLVYKIVI